MDNSSNKDGIIIIINNFREAKATYIHLKIIPSIKTMAIRNLGFLMLLEIVASTYLAVKTRAALPIRISDH
jgi:hypothetical protein